MYITNAYVFILYSLVAFCNGDSVWEDFTRHRTQVTNLIVNQFNPDATAMPTLGLFGAGKSNDINISSLAKLFEVHLLDIDSSSLAFGVAFQNQTKNSKVNTHTVDLSGIEDCFTKGSHISIQDCITRANSFNIHNLSQSVPKKLPFRFTASLCMISQLVLKSLEFGDASLAFAVRNAHIRLLIESTIPRGKGILFTDIVEVSKLPSEVAGHLENKDLAKLKGDEVVKFLRELEVNGTFYKTLDPFGLLFQFESSEFVEHAQLVKKIWWWKNSNKKYLVSAIVFKRSSKILSVNSAKGNLDSILLSVKDIIQ